MRTAPTCGSHSLSTLPPVSALGFLFFQNNLNLLRDLAVLIARDFKSKAAQSQLFVLHRYGGVQIFPLSVAAALLTPVQTSRKNVSSINRTLNCFSLLEGSVIKGMC